VYKSRTIGIVLSGVNGDGTLGLIAIKQVGGTTIAQNPQLAEMPFMPTHGIENSYPDLILSVNVLWITSSCSAAKYFIQQ
jgi:two-component system chemotaxis response regulator CheB